MTAAVYAFGKYKASEENSFPAIGSPGVLVPRDE
jgi:hypothetical protein